MPTPAPSDGNRCAGPLGGDQRDWLVVMQCGDTWVLRPLKPALLSGDQNRLVEEVTALVANGARRLVVNLNAVDDIDGACIGGLIRGFQIVQAEQGSLSLTGLHPWVRRMIDVSGVSRLLPVEDPAAPLSPCA